MGWRQAAVLRFRGSSSSSTPPSSSDRDRPPPAPLFKSRLFADVSDHELRKCTKDTLSRLGIVTMTDIQHQTWPAIRAGRRDVVGRAATGTGKTLAYLLPALERVSSNDQNNNHQAIRVLIIAPTRELVQQIHEQACQLLTSSLALYGGVSKRRDVQALLRKKLPLVLAATPGRLQDHLDTTILHGQSFAQVLSQVQVVVLDEVDRLLDAGFRDTITAILSRLPMQERQTLLFTATLPDTVKAMVPEFCGRGGRDGDPPVWVDCAAARATGAGNDDNDDRRPLHHDPSVGDSVPIDASPPSSIQQSYVVLPTHNSLWALVHVLQYLQQQRPLDYKIMVFVPTTAQVCFLSRLLSQGLGQPHVWELHARRTQNMRTNISDGFRHAVRGMLLTTDVSARGIDYPAVTHVLQWGAAMSRDIYLHRLGRTGRAGQAGTGILLLHEMEQPFLDELRGLNIGPDSFLQRIINDGPTTVLQQQRDAVTRQVQLGQLHELQSDAQAAYRSLLGYLSARRRNWGFRHDPPDAVIATVNALAVQAGLPELPEISDNLAMQAGIRDTSAVHVKRRWSPGASRFVVGPAPPGKVPHRSPTNEDAAPHDDWGSTVPKQPRP